MIPRIEHFIRLNVPSIQRAEGVVLFTEQQLQNYTHAVLLDVLKYVHWYSIDTDDIDRLESMNAIHGFVRSNYEIPKWLKGEKG